MRLPSLPASSYSRRKDPLPVVVFLHGESFEWGSGNIYDGASLASLGSPPGLAFVVLALGIDDRLRIHASRFELGVTDRFAHIKSSIDNHQDIHRPEGSY